MPGLDLIPMFIPYDEQRNWDERDPYLELMLFHIDRTFTFTWHRDFHYVTADQDRSAIESVVVWLVNHVIQRSQPLHQLASAYQRRKQNGTA